MTKAELVAAIANEAGVSQKDAGACLDAFFGIVSTEVGKGRDVAVPGWIKFSRVDRKARIARNPRTGEEIKVPKSKAVKVTIGSKLKASVK